MNVTFWSRGIGGERERESEREREKGIVRDARPTGLDNAADLSLIDSGLEVREATRASDENHAVFEASGRQSWRLQPRAEFYEWNTREA